MDFYDSKAAVDAMAALQARIKELESGNSKLRKEASRLKVLADQDESEFQDKANSLLELSENAQVMLDSASETLLDLRRIRKENRMLQKEFDDLQNELNVKKDAEKKIDDSITEMEKKKVSAKKLMSEYEALFKEILAPPALDLELAGNVVFNSTTITPSTYSFPATIQTVVQEIQTLPFPFRDQKLDKKRQILSTLLKARDIASKIADEIHELELKTKDVGAMKRLQIEIDAKATHYHIITQAMSRFRFE